MLKKKGLACLVLRILRRAEVCLCHQLLDHPHKTFSVSSTASQSSGRSSWPTKRPSLPQRGTAGFDVLGPPKVGSMRYQYSTGVSSPIHQWHWPIIIYMMYIYICTFIKYPRHEQDPTGSNTQRGFPWFFPLGTGGIMAQRVARLKAMLNLLDEELDKVKRSPGG